MVINARIPGHVFGWKSFPGSYTELIERAPSYRIVRSRYAVVYFCFIAVPDSCARKHLVDKRFHNSCGRELCAYCVPSMALFQAAAIIKFIDISTGIISPTNWQLVIAVRINPFPTPTTKPETYAIDLNIVKFYLLYTC